MGKKTPVRAFVVNLVALHLEATACVARDSGEGLLRYEAPAMKLVMERVATGIARIERVDLTDRILVATNLDIDDSSVLTFLCCTGEARHGEGLHRRVAERARPEVHGHGRRRPCRGRVRDPAAAQRRHRQSAVPGARGHVRRRIATVPHAREGRDRERRCRHRAGGPATRQGRHDVLPGRRTARALGLPRDPLRDPGWRFGEGHLRGARRRVRRPLAPAGGDAAFAGHARAHADGRRLRAAAQRQLRAAHVDRGLARRGDRWLAVDCTAGQTTYIDASHIRLADGPVPFRPQSLEVLDHEPKLPAVEASQSVVRRSDAYPFTSGAPLVYTWSRNGQQIGDERVVYSTDGAGRHMFDKFAAARERRFHRDHAHRGRQRRPVAVVRRRPHDRPAAEHLRRDDGRRQGRR